MSTSQRLEGPSSGAMFKPDQMGRNTSDKHPVRKKHLFFRVTAGRFDDDDDQKRIDWVADWVHQHFAEDLKARPSLHAYITTLPAQFQEKVEEIRNAPEIHETLRAQFKEEVIVTPMRATDEVYICHYNKDLAGDHGLFAKHHDGNLRFIPFGGVVRALVYARSAGDMEVVFDDSEVRHRFETHDLALLDFHRELHWVEGDYDPTAPERILLKINYLVVPRSQAWVNRPLFNLNLGQFYVIKAAMEYSKSPKTPFQWLVGLLCNATRLTNNIHPLLPHAMYLTMALTLGLGVWGLLSVFF